LIETSARLLKLLSLLQRRRFWPGAELAGELGITERSVRRDVERLRSLGYPVHAAAGVGGGYQLGAGKELPPLPLEDDEAVAVVLGLRAASAGPIRGLEEAAVRALVKLEQVLPARLRKRVNALAAVSVRMGPSAAGSIDSGVLTALASACRNEETLHFTYGAPSGAETVRTVEPYRLVHTSQRWYLLAFDLEREAWRTFRVDRVGTSVRTARRFTARPLPAKDVASYVSRSVSTEVYPFKARVTVHASAAIVSQRMSAVAAHVEPSGESRCVLHTGAASLEALAFHLGFLGFEFQVHEPPELRDAIREIAERLARATRP